MPEIDVQANHVTKIFGRGKNKLAAVDDVSFQIDKGEFFCLIGPSGCGKTTFLKLVAGLIMPEGGKLYIKGQDMENVPTHKRPLSMVFQTWALFPHMNVQQNVAFGLKMRGIKGTELDKRVKEAINLVRLEELADRMPRELSGGQMQRVGLGRALAIRPDVLLLDEPLGNLDFKLRRQMEIELKLLHEKVGITFIYVTHDQLQAMALANRIMVMNFGRIEQIGSPEEIYNSPNSLFTAKFVGESNLISGKCVAAENNRVSLESEFGRFDALFAGDGSKLLGKTVYLIIRPERMSMGKDAEAKQHLEASVTSKIYEGTDVTYIMDVKGMNFRVRKPAYKTIAVNEGEKVKIGWNVEDGVLLDKVSSIPGIDLERVVLGE